MQRFWLSRSTSRNVIRDNPNSVAVLPEIFRDYRSAAAVMAFPFPLIRTFCAKVQFRSAVNVKLCALWRRPFRYTYTSASGRRLARKYTVNCCASVPIWPFLASTGKSMPQYSSQLHAIIIRQKLSHPVRCVSLVHSTTTFILETTLLRCKLPHVRLTCITKAKSLRTHVL